jgi:3-oxoacyl-[acyl-carrier protein] reductase
MNTVVITGASRGIGAAIAQEFKNHNWYVIGTSTHKDSPSTRSVDRWLYVDLKFQDDREVFCNEILTVPNLKAVVNNAGINIIKEQSEVTPTDYAAIHQVNLEGPYFVSKAAAIRMAELGGGRIVNISSIWSVVSKEQRTLYSTMKTALLGLTRAMAVEWAKRNILVNCVSPGFVNTELTRRSLSAEQQREVTALVPLGRLAEPEEIAKVVLFLCSSQNSYITGQNFVVDGGFTVR